MRSIDIGERELQNHSQDSAFGNGMIGAESKKGQVNTGESIFVSLHSTDIYGNYKVLCQLPLVGLLMLLFITWKDFLVLFVIYDHDIKLITSFTVKTITRWLPSHSLLTIAACVHKDKGRSHG